MRHTDLMNAIEELVDRTCADSVIEALAAVCAAKAAHIDHNYGLAHDQRDPDAFPWEQLALKLAGIPNLGV